MVAKLSNQSHNLMGPEIGNNEINNFHLTLSDLDMQIRLRIINLYNTSISEGPSKKSKIETLPDNLS